MTLEERAQDIISRAAELMVKEPDWSVNFCLHAAAFEHEFIHGKPGCIEQPVGFISGSQKKVKG